MKRLLCREVTEQGSRGAALGIQALDFRAWVFSWPLCTFLSLSHRQALAICDCTGYLSGEKS